MSIGIDPALVKKTYEQMSDKELARKLIQDVAGLTPEALQIVKDEVAKRNLDPNIINAVEAQQKIYNLEEIDAYCEIIRNLPCPLTGNTSEKLNGTLTARTMSFIIFTSYQKVIVIGCPSALDKANNRALFQSVALGWWGLPWGIIRTIQAIRLNLRSKRNNHIQEPTNYLRKFVLSKIGEIVAYKDHREKLIEAIF